MKLQVALKEWDVLCDAVRQGQQILLLRKGGIYEESGQFRLEHQRFLLFPTYVHQNPHMLKAPWSGGLRQELTEPKELPISVYAEVTDILQLTDRRQLDPLDDAHIWTAPLIDMRFNYRPYNPLYLILVRAFALPGAVMIENAMSYAGCKSWVPLEEQVDVGGAMPALSEEAYEQRRQSILSQLKA